MRPQDQLVDLGVGKDDRRTWIADHRDEDLATLRGVEDPSVAVLPRALGIYQALLEYGRARSGREDNLVFLSRDQTEALLTEANMREGLEPYGRALVAMCRSPWDVDVGLSASGICYHGNFGTRPDNVCHRFLLLKRNYDKLTDPASTFE
ncbi:MAG: hypothetical protein ACYCOU_02340 [Sulfobacillus sp.]